MTIAFSVPSWFEWRVCDWTKVSFQFSYEKSASLFGLYTPKQDHTGIGIMLEEFAKADTHLSHCLAI
jgi:hypothetical protein